MRLFRISDAADKKDAMLIYEGGAEIRRLEKSLQDLSRDNAVYGNLKGELSDYCAPKKNIHFSTYVFLKMRPQTGESMVSLLRLRADRDATWPH